MVHPVFIPDDLGLKRNILCCHSHVDGRSLTSQDLLEYDFNTILYDVFFDFGNRHLCLIGPPLLNLKDHLLPIEVSLNGEVVYRIDKDDNFSRLFLVEIPLLSLPKLVDNEVLLGFNSLFTSRFFINRNVTKGGIALLAALQKNNSLKWIEDWIDHYCNRFEIDKIVIYDNGSINVDDIARKLPLVDIVFWNFKYGPVRSHENKYCQLAMLNHVRLKYGGAKLIYNFDIDELLYLKNIDKIMEKKDIVLIDSYWVPNTLDSGNEYSFSDYRYVEKLPRGEAHKYVYKPGKVSMNLVHSCCHINSRSVLYKILQAAKRLLAVFRLRAFNGFFSFVEDSLFSKTAVLNLSDGFYLHFKGITTNWKKAYWDRSIKETSLEKYVEMDSLIGVFEDKH